jgi:16S rRNA (guanine527-N7)-methyltransferase
MDIIMDAIEVQFSDLLKTQGVFISGKQLNQFAVYYNQLVAWNEKMNLTGITEREQVYIKHFYDSVSLSFYFSVGDIVTLADIGSGAGFPSIPLKILFPHLKVTIVDSLNKRILFLRHIVNELNLADVDCVHGRAEDISRLAVYRDQFDLVTARAVARLNALNEFCLPFAKKGGYFIAMKGSDPNDELYEAKFSLSELNAKLLNIHSFELPIEQAKRHIIIFEKIANTPGKYPRRAGLPLKEPLV